jgi:hypothetical protein
MDAHLGIAWLFQPFENHSQRFICVDKNSAQGKPPAIADFSRCSRREARALSNFSMMLFTASGTVWKQLQLAVQFYKVPRGGRLGSREYS